MIKPLQDYVVLEKLPEEKKVGSLILTKAEKRGNVASVLALGPGRVEDGKLIPITSLKVGDKVVYREYAGTEYEEGEHKYLLLKEDDVLAIIE